MPMEIVRNDITRMKVDAVVCASNTELKMGGGVSGAIFAAAGAEKLKAECGRIGGCGIGEAVITKGFGLPARYIIHTAGPVWMGGGCGEEELLRSCYTSSLSIALKNGCRSIAFPLIASGIYGYPKDKALQAAISAIGGFLMEHELEVYLVVYDRKAFALSEKLFTAVTRYIDDNYVDERFESRRSREAEYIQSNFNCCEYEIAAPELKKRSLEDLVEQLDETFSESVLRLIDEKGMTDVEVYKKANIDRKLFSKLRSAKEYKPSKNTALALAVALGLNLDETRDLLGRAGFALSHSSKSDIIVEFFIREGCYNVFELNETLFAFDQELLGLHK